MKVTNNNRQMPTNAPRVPSISAARMAQAKSTNIRSILHIFVTSGSVIVITFIVMIMTGLIIKNSAQAAAQNTTHNASQLSIQRQQNSIERQQANATEALSADDIQALSSELAQPKMPLSKPQTGQQVVQTSGNLSPKQLTQIKGNTASGKLTREQVIAARLSEQQIKPADATFANQIYHEFSFYEAYSRLYEDDDFDGFYQTFGVIFDADVFGNVGSDTAEVFAELYLSQDGGPWEHYFTTDIFIIQGDSETDDYEVITTLDVGYDLDHYDVLIDLYEVGYSDIVATISADDTDGLYALPLESAQTDVVYQEVIIVETETYSGGALSSIVLGLLAFVAFWRRQHFA